MGSVKDLKVLRQPVNLTTGIGLFEFSRRFSIFDYGEMPDLIPSKGSALAVMSAVMFEELRKAGVATHYYGLVDHRGRVVRTKDLFDPSSEMKVGLVRVVRPIFINGSYDYSNFLEKKNKNVLIPLELIYRNSLPEGSSVFKRLKDGTLTLEEIGLTEYPKAGQKLETPFIDISTKLEERGDRYLSWHEAQKMLGLSDAQIQEIKDILMKCNKIITRMAVKAGIENEDGKIELAFDGHSRIIVVDVLGTPDECRFSFNGVPLSKQILRDYYKTTTWYQEVLMAKERADNEGIEDWKQYCSPPPKLPIELIKTVERVNTSIANAFLGRKLFKVAPTVEESAKAYTIWKEKIG